MHILEHWILSACLSQCCVTSSPHLQFPDNKSYICYRTDSIYSKQNKAIVDRLRPQCAIPAPTSRPITDSSNTCNQASDRRVPLHGPDQFAIMRRVRLVGHLFPQKNWPFPFGDRHPHVTHFLRPSPLIIPHGISIDSVVCVWVQNAMLYNALLLRKKTLKNAPSPWDFITLP